MNRNRFLILLLVFCVGCQAASPKGKLVREAVPSGLSSFEERELQVGQEIHERITNHYYLYTEPRINGYVADIGKLLVSYSERPQLPYRFVILTDSRVYATSAPGGFVYVTTGFLNFLDNEAELAAVLAHEVGQIQYKDPRLSHFKKTLNFLNGVGTAIGGIFGGIGAISVLGLQTVSALTDEKPKDSRVTMADKKALRYMLEAGYDPQGLIDVLEKIMAIEEKNHYLAFDYQSTRPVSKKRMRKLLKNFRKLDLQGKQLSMNRDRYEEFVKGVREIYEVRNA